MPLRESVVLSLAIAALLASLVSPRSSFAQPPEQGGSPADPPLPPPASAPKPTPPPPEQLVKDLIEHLEANKKAVAEPIPLEKRPPRGGDLDWELRYRQELFACILAVTDAEGALEKYGRTTYKNDPKKLDEFEQRMKQFRAAVGRISEQADRGVRAREEIDKVVTSMKLWSPVTCPGEDCYFEDEAKKSLRKQGSQ